MEEVAKTKLTLQLETDECYGEFGVGDYVELILKNGDSTCGNIQSITASSVIILEDGEDTNIIGLDDIVDFSS